MLHVASNIEKQWWVIKHLLVANHSL